MTNMIMDDLKNTSNNEPSMDDPDYEDDKLGATMMDVDIAKLNKDKDPKNHNNTAQSKKEDKEESVDDLLKKQKSIIGRIGNIFGKK